MDEQLGYKVRIAALWLLGIIAFFAYRTLAVSEQAREVSLLGDQDFASFLGIMMVFAFLSLTLPSRLNRVTNMIAGGIFLALELIMLADGLVGYGSEPFNAMTGVTVMSMASVMWLAFRWGHGARGVRTQWHDSPSGTTFTGRATGSRAA